MLLWWLSYGMHIRRAKLRALLACLRVKLKAKHNYPKSFGKVNCKGKDSKQLKSMLPNCTPGWSIKSEERCGFIRWELRWRCFYTRQDQCFLHVVWFWLVYCLLLSVVYMFFSWKQICFLRPKGLDIWLPKTKVRLSSLQSVSPFLTLKGTVRECSWIKYHDNSITFANNILC